MLLSHCEVEGRGTFIRIEVVLNCTHIDLWDDLRRRRILIVSDLRRTF